MRYDLTQLKKLSGNDENFIREMLQTFKRTAPPALGRMREYAALGKFEAAGREAHKLIPGVNFLGARELGDLLVKIEILAKNGSHADEIPSFVHEADNMVKTLISDFENDFHIP